MNIGLGVIIAVLAGAINGLFALPMKLAGKWAWENVWLPFSLLGMAVFPLFAALQSVPELGAAYSRLSGSALLIPALWGMAVYTGSLLFGVSLKYISTSLAFALLVGAMSLVGVLGPVMAFNPAVLGAAGGRWILAGVGFLLAALGLCGLAGSYKSRAQQTASGASFTGMLLAIVGGVLSGLLSLGMSMEWARRVTSAAVEFGGARQENAANAVLLLILAGGAVPNCLYCVYLLNRNRTWAVYRGFPRYWLIILLMAVMYSGSVALWGISTSANMLGPLGPSVGWALFIGTIVIASNAGGFLAGEWKGAGAKAVRTMLCGLGLIVCAMLSIGYGNYLLNS
jgi:L-rhamnose-H+ transport protein